MAWALALWLACGGEDRPDLPSPFTSLQDAARGAVVKEVDPKHLHLEWVGGDFNTVANRIVGQLERDGWVRTEEKGMGTMLGIDLARGTERWSLILARHSNQVDAVLDVEADAP